MGALVVGPQAVVAGWERTLPKVGPESPMPPPGALRVLTCLSEMLMGSRSTIQVTLSLSGGVVREPR